MHRRASEHTCPGEMSKSWQLGRISQAPLEGEGIEVEILDLSRVTSGLRAATSSLQGLASPRPPRSVIGLLPAIRNHSLGQTQDWMNEYLSDVGRRPTADDHHPGELVSSRRSSRVHGRPAVPTAATPIRIHRRHRRREGKGGRAAGGTIPPDIEVACSRWWCMATWRAPRMSWRSVADWLRFDELVSRRDLAANLTPTSATGSPTRRATRRSTTTRRCRAKCATPLCRLPRR